MQQMKVLLVMICASTCLFGCIAPGGQPPFPTAAASLREEVTQQAPIEVTIDIAPTASATPTPVVEQRLVSAVDQMPAYKELPEITRVLTRRWWHLPLPCFLRSVRWAPGW